MPSMSLETAEFWNVMSNWALILSLVIGLSATYLIVVTGSVKESHLKKELSSAKLAAENAHQQAATANLEAEKAKLDREKLKKEISWRNVTEEQVSIIRNTIPQPHPNLKIWFQALTSDPETKRFSQQILNAINSSNFEIEVTAFMAGLDAGIYISPNGESNLLKEALELAGFQVFDHTAYPNGSDKSQIVISIGSKPMPKIEL